MIHSYNDITIKINILGQLNEKINGCYNILFITIITNIYRNS